MYDKVLDNYSVLLMITKTNIFIYEKITSFLCYNSINGGQPVYVSM